MPPRLLGLLFGLAAIAPVAATVPQFRFLFTDVTRWLFLLALFLPVLVSGDLFAWLSKPFGIVTGVFAGWCLLTALWSPEPQLTMMKAFSLALTSMALASAGMAWARIVAPLHLFTPLAGFTAVALAAVMLGLPSEKAFDVPTEGLMLLQGAVAGSNLLGIMQTMAVPFLAWRLYCDRSSPPRTLLWTAVLLVVAISCFLSGSRGAMIAMLISLIGFVSAFGWLRLTLVAAGGALAIIGLLVSAPQVSEGLHRVIYKTLETDQDLFHTRQDTWEESWTMARLGGTAGAGFGVSIGSESFQGGFTAVGYGREKGNSQLAIAEEIGIVGLILYAVLLTVLFVPLLRTMARTGDMRRRVACGIVLGSLAGLLSQSLFEAWFLAPGAPESSFFWAVAGYALGLATGSARPASTAALRLANAGPPASSPIPIQP